MFDDLLNVRLKSMKESEAETNAKNLEARFDRGADVLDYFDLKRPKVIRPPRLGTLKRESVRSVVRENAGGYSVAQEVPRSGEGRSVYHREGRWLNKRNDAERAGSVHATQKEAWEEARKMLRNAGGGQLTVMDRDGKIVSKDKIGPQKVP